MQIILASSSEYRKALLSRLGLPFECISHDIDETAKPGESPQALVERLAIGKAKAIGQEHHPALIIGSDQVAVLDGKIIGKPEDHQAAVEQLKEASGNEVNLYTGLCLFNTETGVTQHCVEPYSVVFRRVNDEQIEQYLRKDQPYNCAGSLKSESLGIAMLSKLQGDDPNTLVGLPLIRLVDMLVNERFDPLTA